MSTLARAARATGVAVAVVAPGALAHVSAGGALPPRPVTLVLVGLSAVAYATGGLRLTFARLLAVAAAAQPLLHTVFSAGAGPSGVAHTGHADHAGHRHEFAASVAAHADWQMVSSHLVATLVVAVALRWGLRWLRRLPSIGRAFVLAGRRVRAPRVVRVRFAPPAPPLRRDLAVLAVRGSRGPPR